MKSAKQEESELNVMAFHYNTWTKENITKIGKEYGSVGCLDKCTEDKKNP